MTGDRSGALDARGASLRLRLIGTESKATQDGEAATLAKFQAGTLEHSLAEAKIGLDKCTTQQQKMARKAGACELTLVPISAQLEVTLPFFAQLLCPPHNPN